MPRTLNATLSAALDSQNFSKPIIRGWLGTDGTRDYQVTVVRYELNRTSLKATIYDTNHIVLENSDPNTLTLERGLNIAGVEYTVFTTYFYINKFKRIKELIELDCSIFSQYAYFTTPGDVSYATVLSNYLSTHPPKYLDNSALWKNYKFYPSGKIISVNRSENFLNTLIQKYFIFITENAETTTQTLVFSINDVFARSTDWTIAATKADKVLWESKSKSYRWVDEVGTIHTLGSGNTVHNLGYLESTASPPNASAIGAGTTPFTLGHIEVEIPFHLKYQTGDRVTFTNPYNASDFDCALEVTEILNPDSNLVWYLRLKELDFIGNTEGGAMPSTIERVSNFTPLNTSYFAGVLSSGDNNLQAAMETIDDHDHSGVATTEGVQDIVGAMVSSNTETGIAVTYDDTNGKLNFDAQTAGDARYAPIAKGVTNGDSHDHNGGDGAQIAHTSLSSIGTNTHAQIDTFIATTAPATYAPIAKGVTNGDSHNHVGGDGAALNYTDVIAAFLNSVTVAASSTYYGAPFKTGVDATAHQFPWPEAGDLSDMSVRISSNQPASGSMVVTLQVNGSDTTIVATIAAGSAGPATFSDTTHTVTIAATDTLRWKFVNNATAASAALTSVGMKLKKQTT